MNLIRVASAVLLAALSATAVGCSGYDQQDQQTAAEAWVSDVCKSAVDWRTAISDAQTTLSDTGSLSADIVRDTVDDVTTATRTFVNDLAGMGTPDTEAGDEAAAQIATLSDQLDQQSEIVSNAISESSDSLQDLLGQVSTVTGAIATMLTDVGTAVDNIRQLDGAQELEDAIRDSSACQELHASPAASS